jgi:hypothetical protein
LKFSIHKKLLDEAVRRKIHFEVNYGALVTETSPARTRISARTISGSKVLLQYLRGRFLVISSGSSSSIGTTTTAATTATAGIHAIRSLADVRNMGVAALALSEDQGRAYLSLFVCFFHPSTFFLLSFVIIVVAQTDLCQRDYTKPDRSF